MPKKIYTFTSFDLPVKKPDCCAQCPFIGLVPKESLKKGSYNTHICLMTLRPLTKRFTKIRASKRNAKHPLHRPCDKWWNLYDKQPKRKVKLPDWAITKYRSPYIQKNYEELFYLNFGIEEKQNEVATNPP